MTDACTYCGSDIFRHEPVYVDEVRDGDREQAGQFCNYACLNAHVEEEQLVFGASCQIEF